MRAKKPGVIDLLTYTILRQISWTVCIYRGKEHNLQKHLVMKARGHSSEAGVKKDACVRPD